MQLSVKAIFYKGYFLERFKKALFYKAGYHYNDKARRRSSRPPNPPIGGGQANFGGPS